MGSLLGMALGVSSGGGEALSPRGSPGEVAEKLVKGRSNE